ncbi:MAG: hypothetical protein ACFB6S_06910 [Geminicoccaceae bacterium]
MAELPELWRNPPVLEEAATRLYRALGAVNLIHDLPGAGRLDEAVSLLGELRSLAETHPGEPALRLELAKGAVNLMRSDGLLSAGRLDEAVSLLGELRSLARSYPGEPALRESLARGAVNLIRSDGLLGAGRLDEAVSLLGELRSLAVSHPGEPALRLELAKGAVNLIGASLGQDQEDVARQVAEIGEAALREPAIWQELGGRADPEMVAALRNLVAGWLGWPEDDPTGEGEAR